MPATSPPAARSLAAAILPLVVAAVASWAVPSSALAARWLRPVPGEVARPFDYARAMPFAAGAHRGVDLAAAPGSPVRAACAGVVIHAGPVPGGERAVSVRCEGRRRTTYLPLARVAVARGAAVRAGAPLGTVARGHGGLHLGVRREGDQLGYVDPLPLFAPRTTPPRPAVRPPRPRAAPPPVAPPSVAPVRPPVAAPAARRAAPAPRAVAPWPVWVGAALVACGAAGSGTVAVRRRRRVARSASARVAPAP